MQRLEQYDDNGDPIVQPSANLTDADLAEWDKLSRYTPTQDNQGNDIPWWQGLVMYGVTKAIDNTLPGEPKGIQGNTKPGSFAGQNGKTYNQRGSQNAPPAPASLSVGGVTLSPLLLAGLALAAYLALR